MSHLMLDLETMGNTPTSAIASLGAVWFNLEECTIGSHVYWRVDLDSCQKLGMTFNASTIYWWLEQNEDARLELMKRASPIKVVLDAFATFVGVDTYIWGNGATFDNVILSNAYRMADKLVPWRYSHNMDMRTIVYLAKQLGVESTLDRKNVYHNALDDAKHQAKIVIDLWQQIKDKVK